MRPRGRQLTTSTIPTLACGDTAFASGRRARVVELARSVQGRRGGHRSARATIRPCRAGPPCRSGPGTSLAALRGDRTQPAPRRHPAPPDRQRRRPPGPPRPRHRPAPPRTLAPSGPLRAALRRHPPARASLDRPHLTFRAAISSARRPAATPPPDPRSAPQDKPENRDRPINHAPNGQHDHKHFESTKKRSLESWSVDSGSGGTASSWRQPVVSLIVRDCLVPDVPDARQL